MICYNVVASWWLIVVCYVAFVDLIVAGYAGLCVGCFGLVLG